MIRLDFGRFVHEHMLTRHIVKFLYDRIWFGWWFATYCSGHINEHDLTCSLCRSGSWSREGLRSGDWYKIITHKQALSDGKWNDY